LVAGAAEPAWGTLAHSLTTGIGTDDHHAKSHAHTAADGSGAIASDQAISTTAGLTVGTTIAQAVKVLRQVIVKTGIADNSLTSIFRITTTNEADSADGGGYACFVRALIGHALAASGYTANASRVCEYAFSRAIGSAGSGVNSTIATVLDNASAAVSPAARQIDTVTPALLETDEYQNDFQLTIDLSGTLVVTAQAVLEITLIWQGFTTPPTISAL
jgi:hypothetical protein